MGWDAYAVTSIEAVDSGERLNPDLRAIFAEASEKVFQKSGRRGNLEGTLGGPSLIILQLATSLDCIDYASEDGRLFWPKEMVYKVNAKADWDFGLDSRYKAIYDAQYAFPPAYNILDIEDEESFQRDKWEVRVFLETCAENDLAILFSW